MEMTADLRKRKLRFNFKKIFLLLIICIFLVCLFCVFLKSDNYVAPTPSLNNIFNKPKYDIIKLDTNENYLGPGQKKVENKDGYFTTFTTKENYQKTYIEYKQNGNSSWAEHEYWNGPMKETGCGITALAIVLSGYNEDYTPESLRLKYYPVLNYENLSKELSDTFKIVNSGFYYDSVHLSNANIIAHLKTNRPIIICVWNSPSENRFTTTSHYMVLLATDGNMVYISNPNGGENDSKSSGWYELDEIIPYIAKALFIESYN